MSQIFIVHVSYLGFGWYVQNIYIYKYISYRLFHFGWSTYVQENTKGPIKKRALANAISNLIFDISISFSAKLDSLSLSSGCAHLKTALSLPIDFLYFSLR